MKTFIITITIAVLLGMSAHAQIKVKIAPITLNQALPEDFTNRVFWSKTDLFKLNLNQLAGSIIFKEDTAKDFKRGLRIVSTKNPPTVKTVEHGLRYHSKVDKGFNAGLKLFFFSGGMSSSQVADIKISDVAYVFIDYENITIDSIIRASNQITTKGKKYYIQGVLLSTIVQQLNDSVETNSTISGAVFTANGKVYKASEYLSEDFRISLTLIDLDDLKMLAQQHHLSNSDDRKRNILAATLRDPGLISITGFEADKQ